MRGKRYGLVKEDLLKGHFGYTNFIRRHRDERLNLNEQWETLTSKIVDLTEGKMLYTTEPPRSHSYESIVLEETT